MKDSNQMIAAFILHKRQYRETSLLLELMTEDSTRFSAVYPSARRGTKSTVDLCTNYYVSWRGSGSLVTIIKCEPFEQFAIRGKALFAAMYVNELLVKTIRDRDSVEGIYAEYRKVLQNLSDEATDLHTVLRSFERTLLKGLGFELVFDTQADGRPVVPNQTYQFLNDTGFLPVDANDEKGIKGSALLAIDADDYSARETRQVARELLQGAFQQHFGMKPFQSRELFRQAFAE